MPERKQENGMQKAMAGFKEDRLALALQAAGVGIWDFDFITNTLTWDDRCQQLFGFSQNEVIHYHKALNNVYPADQQKVLEAVIASLDPVTGGNFNIQFRSIGTEDKQLRWLQGKGAVHFNEAGTPYLLSGIVQDITGFVTTQHDTVTTEALANRATEATGIGYFRIRLADDHMQYSPLLAQLLTGDATALLTRADFIKKVHPLDRDKRKKAYEEALKTGQLYYETRVVWNDGSEHWICVQGAYEFDQQQNPVYFSGTVHNMSREMNTRLALEASEKRFRMLIEEAPVALTLFTGPDMVIEMPNEAMLKLWGKDATIIGKPLHEAIPELEGQPFLQILQQVYHTGIPYYGEEIPARLPVDGVDGTYYFTFTYKPLRNAEGKVYAILNAATNVTEQVLARQKVAEGQNILNSAVEQAQLGTWYIYPREKKLILSDRLKEWLGLYPEQEILLENILSRIENHGQVENALRKAMQFGYGMLDIEYDVKGTDGQQRIIRAKGQTFFNDRQEAYLLIGTAQDITLQKNTELQLEQQVQLRTAELARAIERLESANQKLALSNQELEQYAYIASHDLQEPLRKIRLFSDLLLQKDELPAGSRNYLDKILHASSRMSLLIRDILDFSRLSNIKEQFQPTDLQLIMTEVLGDFDLLIEEKKSVINIEALPVIEAIPLQMNQLFHNLLSNALKFSKEGRPSLITIRAVKITAAEARAQVTDYKAVPYYSIQFSDNGIGFNQAFAPQVFEIFKRLHSQHYYPGSGIGLALCRRIVQNHYGIIKVTAVENEGTTFEVILPLQQSTAEQ